jgi:hypothetical protein
MNTTIARRLVSALALVTNATMAAGQPLPPTRQVHLDFHTSEHIAGIGERFDKQQWQAALRAGHVNQINIFAKCHHSWSYYPTKVGRMHPNLKFDLLGAQMAACHELGVVCPIYFTVGWSATDAETHPEWCARDRTGASLAFTQENGAVKIAVPTFAMHTAIVMTYQPAP